MTLVQASQHPIVHGEINVFKLGFLTPTSNLFLPVPIIYNVSISSYERRLLHVKFN